MMFYIAGPMRNRPYYNFEAFDTAEAVILANGHNAWNPASADRMYGFDPRTCKHPKAVTGNIPNSEFPCKLSMKEIARLDLAHLMACDGIVMLDEWWTSVGARAEVAIATWVGIPMFHLTPPTAYELVEGRLEPPNGYPL